MTYDVAVVGGGIVGIATAHALLRKPGLSVLVLEAESRLAAHQTGHNSGVIHSGLYYKPGSLKAALGREGRRMLLELCETHGVPHKIGGKLVVATRSEELPALAELERRGAANGLLGVRRVAIEEARELEPHVSGLAALVVPEAGVVDFTAVTGALARDIAANGGEVKTSARLLSAARSDGELRLATTAGDFGARVLVNCAGLASDRVARLCGVQPPVRIVPFRGDYYELVPSRAHLVKSLVYPVPDPRFPFLGVHFTRRVTGLVEAGPSAVLALKRDGYSRFAFSPRDAWAVASFPGFWRFLSRHAGTAASEVRRAFSAAAFARAARLLVPEIRDEDLRPAGCGVRAQAMAPDGRLVDDFLIVEAERMVHVLNAPSPAATASLAIGREIAAWVAPHLS